MHWKTKSDKSEPIFEAKLIIEFPTSYPHHLPQAGQMCSLEIPIVSLDSIV